MHIGILVTNTDTSAFAKGQPRDGEKFTRLLKAVRPDWTFSAFDCTSSVFPPSPRACDGYLIGGSPASVNDKDAWIGELFELIRTFHAEKRAMAGCCFGHQAIAKALGGEVGKNPGGWGFGVARTEIVKPQKWMQPALPVIELYAAHAEQVTKLPEGATVIGLNDFCPTANYMIGHHIMTTEYHPEMTQDFFVELTHALEKYIGGDVAEEARRQAQQPAQGGVFAEWMARFFETS